MNRLLSTIALAFVSVCALAQVHLDKPLQLTSPQDSLRQIDALAAPSDPTSLITLGAAQQAAVNWYTVTGGTNIIQLSGSPQAAGYSNGMLIRWMPQSAKAGSVRVNVDGLGTRSVYRSDGLQASEGQVSAGQVVEMIYMDTAFFIMGRSNTDCPTGYLRISDEFCMQQNDTLSVSIFTAIGHCFARGARLCTWDEYVMACTVQGAQLSGLFDDWEWIDDTSDHTHTADQVGRFGCRSQRAMDAAEHPNNYGVVRCCYRLR